MSAPLPKARGTFAVVMSRTVVVHALLASAALAFAYVTWTAGDRPDRPQQQRVTVLACVPADVRSAAFISKRRTVRIEWQGDGSARAAWITVTDERPAHGPASEPKRFAANEALDRWLAEHLPLRAVRSLGELDRARLAELELVDTETRLDVDCGSRRASFRLGGSTYGTGDRYARAFAGGPVYLFAAAFASELEGAEARFMQRELHRFTAADVDEVRVETEGRTRTLLHRNRRSVDRATWVDQAEPDRRNELYGNWLDRVAALRITEFLPSGREPDGLITPITSVRYAADGREKGTLVLVRSSGAGAPVYYATSEVTHGWVRVLDSIATQIEQDARPVIGLEPSVDSIAIPAAVLPMGCSPTRDPQCAADEQPVHDVAIAGFHIDRNEVTASSYGECVAAGSCTQPAGGFDQRAHPQRPVTHVTWSQAREFCAWRGARLPREAEWELAARGTDGRIFPWGDESPTCDQAHTSACGAEPADVGGRPLGASPYGVHDMAGNVDEWVEDSYIPYGGGSASIERVARGGAYDAWHARSTARNAVRPEHHDGWLGFRCASDR